MTKTLAPDDPDDPRHGPVGARRPGGPDMKLTELTKTLGYEMGVSRRSDLSSYAIRWDDDVLAGIEWLTLCGGGRATKQSSYRGSDCPRCLALLRAQHRSFTASEDPT